MSILKEGYPFIFPPFTLGLGLILIPRLAGFEAAALMLLGPGIVLMVFALFCVFFFRDPAVTVSAGEDLVLSPCNGTVLEVEKGESGTVVRIFLSIFNVHLQRSPVRGNLTKLEHRDGTFLMAWNPQAHSLNEQNVFTIENENGVFTVNQIAGFLARRCVSWVTVGDELKQGDKIGCIKFSSQVDIHLPGSVKVLVQAGDPVQAAVTIIGELT